MLSPVLSKYIFYIYIVLYLTLVGGISLKSVDDDGERTRSDIILGRLRTGIYTNMMVRTDHVWSCFDPNDQSAQSIVRADYTS